MKSIIRIFNLNHFLQVIQCSFKNYRTVIYFNSLLTFITIKYYHSHQYSLEHSGGNQLTNEPFSHKKLLFRCFVWFSYQVLFIDLFIFSFYHLIMTINFLVKTFNFLKKIILFNNHFLKIIFLLHNCSKDFICFLNSLFLKFNSYFKAVWFFYLISQPLLFEFAIKFMFLVFLKFIYYKIILMIPFPLFAITKILQMLF